MLPGVSQGLHSLSRVLQDRDALPVATYQVCDQSTGEVSAISLEDDELRVPLSGECLCCLHSIRVGGVAHCVSPGVPGCPCQGTLSQLAWHGPECQSGEDDGRLPGLTRPPLVG